VDSVYKMHIIIRKYMTELKKNQRFKNFIMLFLFETCF